LFAIRFVNAKVTSEEIYFYLLKYKIKFESLKWG